MNFLYPHPAATQIYTLSLHDALPILAEIGQREIERIGQLPRTVDGLGEIGKQPRHLRGGFDVPLPIHPQQPAGIVDIDRKSTRLNSSHSQISYAVFCLKKKTSTESRS